MSVESRSRRRIGELHRAVEALEPRRLLAAGDLDSTFGTGGKTTATYAGSADDGAEAIAVLANGRIVGGGDSSTIEDGAAILARYLADGTPDPAFGTGGKVRHDSLKFGGMLDLLVNPADGTMLGLNASAASAVAPVLQRFAADGALDPTWIGPGLNVPGRPVQAIRMDDGRIVLCTTTTLARLNSNGTLDGSFGSGGKVTFPPATSPNYMSVPANGIAVDAAGNVFVAGEQYFAVTTGARRATVRKYTSTGVLDGTFGSGGTAQIGFISTTNSSAASVRVLSDGKLLVTGYSVNDSFIARLTATGAADNTYGGISTHVINIDPAGADRFGRFVLQADGKALVGGYVENTGPFIARISTAGTLDGINYAGNGVIEQPLPPHFVVFGGANLALDSAGRALMATRAADTPNKTYDVTLTRFTTAGQTDTTFGLGNGITQTDFEAPQSIYTGRSSLQPDGKLILIGSPGYTPGDLALRRLNADGTIDSSFGNNGIARADAGARNEIGLDSLVQPDGKILVAGRADMIESLATGVTYEYFLARFNSDGTLDSTFGDGGTVRADFGGTFQLLHNVALLADGSIIASGLWQGDGGVRDAALLRFSAAGDLNASFGIGGMKRIDVAGDFDVITSILPTADGNFLVAGNFDEPVSGSTNPNEKRFVARLDAGGNFVESFGIGGIARFDVPAAETESAVGLVADPAGGLFLGSTYSTTNTTRLLLNKLTETGEGDGTFGAGGEVSLPLVYQDLLNDMRRTPQGQFLFAGRRGTGFSSSNNNFMAIRLNPNGTGDLTFGPNGTRTIDFGSNGDAARDVHLAAGGKIVLAGQVGGTQRGDWGIARLIGDDSAPTVSSAHLNVEPAHALRIDFSEDVLASVDLSDATFQNLTTAQTIDPALFTLNKANSNGATTATWTYAGVAGTLPSGHYRATLPAGAVVDSAGNALAAPFEYSFFTATGTSLQVMREPGTANVRIIGGSQSWLIPLDQLAQIHLNGNAASNTLVVDLRGGSIVGAGGIDVTGGAGPDTLRFIGASGATAYEVDGDLINGSSFTLQRDGFETLAIGDGAYTVNEDLGPVTLRLDGLNDTTFTTSQHLLNFQIFGGIARLGAGGGKVLVTGSIDLFNDAVLDLGDGDMIVDYQSVGPIGNWTGSSYDGITGMIARGAIMSSAATGGASRLTTLGIADAAAARNLSAGQTALFAGETVDATSVLIKFTYGGDANLDGKINIDDYGRIDGHVAQSGAVFGWFFGDFNLDGKINIDDFGIIDGNISRQDGVL